MLVLEPQCWDVILWNAPSVLWPFLVETTLGMQPLDRKIIR